MKKIIVGLFVAALLFALTACNKTAKVQTPQDAGNAQIFKKDGLQTWDREKVAGGTGTLAGKFAFTRNDANGDWVIREIGWMTLNPGDSIGIHGHADNDDAYIIISGTGEFTDTAGNVTPVGPRDITIAHPGQKHALANTGAAPLYFLDVVSKNVAPDDSRAGEPQVFKYDELESWDRQDVAGGKGTLYGKFSYNRNDNKTFPLYEIGWMKLSAGDSIGLHAHNDNEDAYIIVSGNGTFAGTDEKEIKVGEGDITVARPGQKHSLANTGTTDLVFLDIVAK